MSATPPPLSAKAARNAAIAAQAFILDPPIRALDSDNESQDDEELQQVLADALADPQELQQDAPTKLKRPRGAKPTKGKGAGRYFAGTADEDSERPSTRPTSGASTEMEVEGRETFEEAARTTGKGKLGRGKRQRREKSAFLDPVCSSSFSPSAGISAFRVSLPGTEGEQRSAALFCLTPGETLIIHGSYKLTPIFGSSTILGSILTPPPSDTTSISLTAALATPHRVFSPSSHPLPPLEALPPSFASSSTSPSTLSLPDGTSIDLAAFSSVVLVEELGAEIEGVETVLRSSGMGCGNAMWQVEEASSRFEHWGGAGWRLILDPTPSLTSLRPLESWESTLASFGPRGRPATRPLDDDDEEEEEEQELAGGAERLVLLVEGPKRVGKSTFTKLLLNRLLSRYETVAYLDTDLGQPEFTTPGFVSLNVLRDPVLGPSFTHLSLPISSHFLGTTSPASDPSAYLAAVSSLLATFSLDVEYPLTDEAPRRRGAAASSSRSSSKIRDRVPLIINTQGWVKGLGADLLAKLKAEARPTQVVSFEPAAEEGAEGAWSGQEQMVPPPNEYQDPSCQVIRLVGAPSSPLDSKWSAADLRTLALISYFHAVFPRDPAPSDTPRTNTFPSSWDFSTPLVGQTPFAVDWTASQKQIKGVHLLDSDVPYEQVLYALNGSVVALLEDTESIDQLEEMPLADNQSSAQPPAFPLLYSPPPPTTTRSLGLALIRSIDPTTQTLHLLTPVHSSHLAASPLTLVKGAIDLPSPLLLDFKAGEIELNKGVCGTEWKDVPYLTVEEGEQGRKKVRRNLMRRGQN